MTVSFDLDETHNMRVTARMALTSCFWSSSFLLFFLRIILPFLRYTPWTCYRFSQSIDGFAKYGAYGVGKGRVRT